MVDVAPQAVTQTEAAAKASPRRYYVLGLLTIVYALNFLENHPSIPGVPYVAFDDGSAGFGSYNGYPQMFHENIYSYADMMSFQKGKHSLKAGVDIRRNLENSEFNVARPSYYFFDQLFFAADAPYGMAAGTDPGFISGKPAEPMSAARPS